MAQFPSSVPTDADLFIAKNNLSTSLDGAIDNSVTTITVISTTGFQSVGYITIDAEAISYTGVTATTFTGCTRGADGTTAASHLDTTVVYHNVVADHHNVLKDEIIAIADDVLNVVHKNLPNILVNGGVELWERGTSFIGVANGDDTADKWVVGKSGGVPPTANVSRSAADDTGFFAMDVDITAAGSSSPRFSMRNTAEWYESYASKTVSLSVRVNTSLAGVKISLNDGVSGFNSTAHSGSGTWETLTITATLSGSLTQLQVLIGWLDTDVPSTGQVLIDSIMLLEGDNPLGFIPEDPAVRLNRTQRYYEAQNTVDFRALGVSDGTNYILEVPVKFTTTKRTTPTVTLTINAVKEEGAAADQQGSYTITATDITAAGFNMKASKAIAGSKPASLEFDWTAEA